MKVPRVTKASAFVTLVNGCMFTPDYQVGNCALRCESACPTGLECRDSYCVNPDYTGSCSFTSDGATTALAHGSSPDAAITDCRPSDSGIDAGCAAPDGSAPRDAGPDVTAPNDTASDDHAVLSILSPRLLPEGCVGQRYEHRFTATGGAGHYSWTDVAANNLPDWLSLSAEGQLTGVVPLDVGDALEFSIRVAAGAADNPVMRQFQIPIMRHCKFAFIGERNDRARMFLGDARRARVPGQFEAVDLSASFPAAQDVRAFEFAPNGSALAFAVGDETIEKMRSLWVAGTTALDGAFALTEVLPTSTDRVIEGFVWSPESDRLLVLAKNLTTQKHALHSVVLAPEVQAAQEVAIAFPMPWSELFRVGQYACYFTVNGERSCVPFSAPTSDASIFPVDTVSVLANSDLVQWTASGNYQAVFDKGESSDNFALMLLRLEAGQQARSLELYAIPDLSMRLLAQPGDYTNPTVASLFPFGAGPTFGGGATPAATLAGCEVILALQPMGEAIACATEEMLRIAELTGSMSVKSEQIVADGSIANTYGLSRTFNYGSTRYIYDTFDGVMMVDLTQDTWSAQRLIDHDALDRVVFAPLTDGRTLVQVGTTLNVVSSGEPTLERVSGDIPMPAPLWCAESFGAGGPYEWCGSTAQSKSFSASMEARAVVFATQSGQLFIADTSVGASSEAAPSPVPVPVNDATIHCGAKRREHGRPERLALGCEQELKWAP